MAQLVFEIKNQWISRTDTFKPVAKSKNYLYAQFNFLTDEWVGVPTAIFRNKTSAYEQIIGQDGTCLVPWEVIDVEGDSEIFVSVFCGDLVTANKARVHVYDTGYGDDLESDTPPTPSVYEQILNRMAGIEEDMDDATQRAESAAESAEYAAEHYPIIMDEYWYVWDVIEHEYVDTNIKAEAHDGTSATVEVEQIVGGHRVIITDVSGEHTFDVPDGRDGTDGRGIASLEKTSTSGDVDQYTMTFSDGSEPFVYYVTNGASATISTRAITNGYRLTITDKNGTRAIDVLNGAKGDPGNGIQSINKIGSYENYDYYEIRMTNGNKTSFTVTNGYSPTVSTVSLTGGHRVIITDANGSHSFDVMDGNGITNTVLNSDYTLTITFTDGTSYTTPSIRGAKGDTGNGIQSIAKTGTSGLVDTYTITYTNGQTTTFDVTNGETPTVDAGDVPYDDTETYPDGSVGDGLSSVKAEINQLSVDKADIIISSASGTVASFSDGAEYDAVGLVAEFAPYQEGSGDASPTNVRPIHGWTGLDINVGGKNLIPKTAPSQYYQTIPDAGGWKTGDSSYSTFIIPCPKGSIRVARSTRAKMVSVCLCDDTPIIGHSAYGITNMTNRDGYTLDNSDAHKYLAITVTRAVESDWQSFIDTEPRVLIGTATQPYTEPVNIKTTPILWQTEAGEVFGGYVDAVRGKVVATNYAFSIDGTNYYVTNSVGKQTSGTWNGYWRAYDYIGENGLSGLPEGRRKTLETQGAEFMCNKYVSGVPVSGVGGIEMTDIGKPYIRVYFDESVLADVSTTTKARESMRAYLVENPIQVCYHMETPIEYDIDQVPIPILTGTNNIWTSANGNIEVSYGADTSIYISNKQNEIRATIAPIEDGTTASQAYAIGKYFYHNGAFCKAKTAIASGATFTLGTNYEVTTVAAELFTALS